jgi:hypothetical protein
MENTGINKNSLMDGFIPGLLSIKSNLLNFPDKYRKQGMLCN